MATDIAPCAYCESQQEAKKLAMAQLDEAWEERDVAQETVVALSSVAQDRDEFRAERDDAIERGVKLYGWLSEAYGVAWKLAGYHAEQKRRAEQAVAREKRLREALDKSRWMVALLGRLYVQRVDEGGCMTCDRWIDTEGHSESCEYAAMVTHMKSSLAALEDV